MATLAEAARTFLAQPRIAVVGVSRQTHQPANCNFRKLRAAGHTVFAVNPQTATVEGGPCYPTLAAIPGGVQAVLIFTPPAASEAVVREAVPSASVMCGCTAPSAGAVTRRRRSGPRASSASR